MPDMTSARARFGIAASLVVASIAGLIVWALSGASVYYRTPTELAESAPRPAERVRVAGTVVDGSIETHGDETRFLVADGNAELMVVTRDVLPDTFSPGIEVVAEGALTRPGTFTASTVLAKCPSKFKARKADTQRGPQGSERVSMPGSG